MGGLRSHDTDPVWKPRKTQDIQHFMTSAQCYFQNDLPMRPTKYTDLDSSTLITSGVPPEDATLHSDSPNEYNRRLLSHEVSPHTTRAANTDAFTPVMNAIPTEASQLTVPTKGGRRRIRPLPPISVDMAAAHPLPPSPSTPPASSGASLCFRHKWPTTYTGQASRRRPLPTPPSTPQLLPPPSTLPNSKPPVSGFHSHPALCGCPVSLCSLYKPPRGLPPTPPTSALPSPRPSTDPSIWTDTDASSAISVALAPPDHKPPSPSTDEKKFLHSDGKEGHGAILSHRDLSSRKLQVAIDLSSQTKYADLKHVFSPRPFSTESSCIQNHSFSLNLHKVWTKSNETFGECDSDHIVARPASPASDDSDSDSIADMTSKNPSIKRYSPYPSYFSKLLGPSGGASAEVASKSRRYRYLEDWAPPTSWKGPTFVEKSDSFRARKISIGRARSIRVERNRRGPLSFFTPPNASSTRINIWTDGAPWEKAEKEKVPKLNGSTTNLAEVDDVIITVGIKPSDENEKWETKDVADVISQLRKLKVSPTWGRR